MALDTAKVAEKAHVWGDAGEYAGHGPHSVSLMVHAYPDIVAAADRHDFDPLDEQWEGFPGAAARANGWPRADGRSQ